MLNFKAPIFWHILSWQVSNSAQKIELQDLLDCFSEEYLHMVALLSVTSVIAV